MAENGNLLEIKNLSVRFSTEYAEVYAVNGVNLTIENGESLGLVGESGAGKTTTALASLNLLPSNATISGDILYKGKSVRGMSTKELMGLRGDKISMIFQNPLTALNPVFTVGEQISMVLRTHTELTRKEARKKTQELLQMVGIEGWRYNDYPNQFSGGMRQRVGIAASLACNPELLIADEPTTALDVTIQAQVLELMRELKTKYSTGLIIFTTNIGIIGEVCKKCASFSGV
jgi:peptide/nickel transport system ATP-binding protein